jgi:hypothetical protein
MNKSIGEEKVKHPNWEIVQTNVKHIREKTVSKNTDHEKLFPKTPTNCTLGNLRPSRPIDCLAQPESQRCYELLVPENCRG